MPINNILHRIMTLKFCRYIIIFSILVHLSICSTRWPQLIFQNGIYNNIIIGVSSTVEYDGPDCQEFINKLKDEVSKTSSLLEKVGVGRFGTVKILLPSSWSNSKCSFTETVFVAPEEAAYENAHFKITNEHPIAIELPWTKQYGECGKTGEAIYIPASFIESTVYQKKEQMILHEWAKWRYGVFEEFGFHNDPLFPPCYMEKGELRYTTCTTISNLQALGNDSATCEESLASFTDKLKDELSFGLNSIMATPHIGDVLSFFSMSSHHNRLQMTKQNTYCNQRSTHEIIRSHPDFPDGYLPSLSNNDINILQFELYRKVSPERKGYAFVIEDSETIRQKDRLKLVNQAVTHVVDLLDISDANEVFVMRFNEQEAEKEQSFTITNVDRKLQFLATMPYPSSTSLRNEDPAAINNDENDLYIIFQKLLPYLTGNNVQWNIIMITAKPSIQLNAAMTLLAGSPHALSLATFENSSANWYELYGHPYTKTVINLPHCYNEVNELVCSTHGSSMLMKMMDQSIESFNNKRKFYLVEERTMLTNESLTTFRMPDLDLTDFRMFFHIPTHGVPLEVNLRNPWGQACQFDSTLGYTDLWSIDFSQCSYAEGEWQLSWESLDTEMKLYVYAVHQNSEIDRLHVSTKMSLDFSTQFHPSADNLSSIFVSVIEEKSEAPITNANVELSLYHTLDSETVQPLLPTLKLKDDGIQPDFLANDGIYSATIQTYAPEAAYHHGTISLDLSSAQKIDSVTSSAALLDPLLSSKCCGSQVQIEDSTAITLPNTRIVIPGFKTGGSFSSENIPPGKIQFISVLSENEAGLTLSFQSPESLNGLNYYEICCNLDIDDETNMDDCIQFQNCNPANPGETQECVLSRSMILDGFDAQLGETYYRPVKLFLPCGVRGFSTNEIPGPLSGNLVEVEIDYVPSKEVITEIIREKAECSSISDDCLPIWVFWLLLGLLIFLVLVFVALIVICCLKRGGKKQTKNKPRPQRGYERSIKHTEAGEKRLEPVFVPARQNGPISGNSDDVNNNKPSFNQSEYENDEVRMETERTIPSNRSTYNDTTADHHDDITTPNTLTMEQQRNMVENSIGPPSTQNNQYQPPVNGNQTPTTDHYSDLIINRSSRNNGAQSASTQNEIVNKPMPKDRTSKSFGNTNNEYGNNTVVNSFVPPPPPLPPPNTGIIIPSAADSTTTDSSNPPNNKQTTAPVYATVNKTYRQQGRPLVGLADTSAFLAPVYSSPIITTKDDNAPTIDRYPQRFKKLRETQAQHNLSVYSEDDDNNNDTSSVSTFKSPQFTVTGNFGGRLDAFPSSDSDTYSDMSRGVAIPPPPPLPSAMPPLRSQSMEGSRMGGYNGFVNNGFYPGDSPSIIHQNNGFVSHGFPETMNKSVVTGRFSAPPAQRYDESSDEYDDDSEHWDDASDSEVQGMGASYA